MFPPNPDMRQITTDRLPSLSPKIRWGPTTYYDQYGNEISEEEALTSRLKDKNGNVVCEYIHRRNFVFLRYTPKDGTVLPITVCTEDDLQEARQTAAVRHVFLEQHIALNVLLLCWSISKKDPNKVLELVLLQIHKNRLQFPVQSMDKNCSGFL